MPFNISHYAAPRSLPQLWETIQEAKQTPVFLSGGIELLLRARDGFIPSYRTWIDLTTIPELCGIKRLEKALWIGASTPYSQLLESDLVQTHATALYMAAQQLGAWQIRNRSTIGGNASRGADGPDLLPALYALNAQIICHNGTTERQLRCEDFYISPHQTALQNREVITGILIPTTEPPRFSVFNKLKSRTVRSTAKVSVAVSVYVHNGNYSQARIALGGVGGGVARATTAEGLLEGQPISHIALLDRVADEIRRAANPTTDLRSSARYRKWSIGILGVRSLKQIIEQHQLAYSLDEQKLQPSEGETL